MIVITGANGFIGSSTLKHLSSRGYKVVGIVRSTSNLRRVKGFTEQLRFADLLDVGSLSTALKDCEILIHCAARSLDWGRQTDFIKANVIGVEHVIQTAIRVGRLKKVIYISSANVVGFGKRDMSETREDTPKLLFRYSRTKLEGEGVATRLCKKRGIELIILRPSAVYGPEDWKWSYEMVDRLAHSYWPLLNMGRAVFTPVFIENLCRAIELTVMKNGMEGVYNITDNVTVSWVEFCEKIAFHLGVPSSCKSFSYPIALCVAFLYETFHRLFFAGREPKVTVYRVIRSAKDFHYSCNMAIDKLGYRPDSDLNSHIRKMVGWYRGVTSRLVTGKDERAG
jgi:nucleoside-diphosphate-sugar epimerase